MSDLISRRAAIESISKLFHPIGGSVLDEDDKKRYDEGVDDALQEIEELPSAQPEIIYCKDCKYSEYHKLYGDRFCQYDNVVNVVPDLHYCGYAERRTDG